MRSSACAGVAQRSRAAATPQRPRISGGRAGEGNLGSALDCRVVVLVEGLFGEAHGTSDESRRETLDGRVEVANGRIVIAPRSLQLPFNAGQLILQLEEVLIRLELGIGLGNREQASEDARHLRIRLRGRLD